MRRILAASVMALACGMLPFAARGQACALDPGYGDAGRARVPLPAAGMSGIDATLDPLGRLVVAVQLAPASTGAALLRLDRDGRPDPTFGQDGVLVEQRFQAGESGYPWPAVAVDPSGAIHLAAEGRDAANGSVVAVARYDDAGVPDGLFGIDGIARQVGATPSDIAVAADGRVVVALVSPTQAALRFTAGGELDTTFADGGFVLAPVVGVTAMAVALDGDRIVLGGRAAASVWAARYTDGGVADAGFGAGSGFVQLATGNANTDIRAMAVDASGGIALVGDDTPPGPPFDERYEIVAARFDANGVPVADFANGGLLGRYLAPDVVSRDSGGGVAIEADGALTIAAISRNGETTGDLALLRLDATGEPQSSGCASVTRFETQSGTVGYDAELMVDGDRRLLVGYERPATIHVLAIDPGRVFGSGFE